MRSSPTGNNTLLRIQQEISEVAQRESELRNLNITSNGITTNGLSTSIRTPSPTPPATSPTPPPPQHQPPPLQRAVSTSALNVIAPATNGINARRYIPNSNAKGVMQKFFKSRGKISTVAAITGNGQASHKSPVAAWQPSETLDSPTKALIPTDKPLRKGYVPVEERIQKELREMKHREQELRTIRRKSQPDLMAAIEAEQNESYPSSRASSPRLRPARSYSQLLDDEPPEDTSSAPPSLRPARSLAELCDAADEDIESPRTLIQQWETRIKQLQAQQVHM